MKHAARDILIFACIGVATWLIMQFRGDRDRRVEMNRGEVIYGPGVSFDEADGLARYLLDAGAFTGDQVTVRLDQHQDTYRLRLVVQPEVIAVPRLRESLLQSAQEMCAERFASKRVTVEIANDRLEPVDVLIPPTTFPPAAAN